jgi:hypothetical protein
MDCNYSCPPAVGAEQIRAVCPVLLLMFSVPPTIVLLLVVGIADGAVLRSHCHPLSLPRLSITVALPLPLPLWLWMQHTRC